jgi:hypothetical protein
LGGLVILPVYVAEVDPLKYGILRPRLRHPKRLLDVDRPPLLYPIS